MEKTNIAVTFAVIALSAIPLMAQQVKYTSPNKDTRQEIQNAVQSDVVNNELNRQHQNIISNINEDINSTAKYQNLLQEYVRFLALMNDESLNKLSEETVGQTIFIKIDDLAKAILNLPEHARPYYIKLITESKYNFKYNNKVVTLEDLLNLSKNLTSIYTSNSTPIVKVLNKKSTIQNTTSHSFWQEFFKAFVQSAQIDK